MSFYDTSHVADAYILCEFSVIIILHIINNVTLSAEFNLSYTNYFSDVIFFRSYIPFMIANSEQILIQLVSKVLHS